MFLRRGLISLVALFALLCASRAAFAITAPPPSGSGEDAAESNNSVKKEGWLLFVRYPGSSDLFWGASSTFSGGNVVSFTGATNTSKSLSVQALTAQFGRFRLSGNFNMSAATSQDNANSGGDAVQRFAQQGGTLNLLAELPIIGFYGTKAGDSGNRNFVALSFVPQIGIDADGLAAGAAPGLKNGQFGGRVFGQLFSTKASDTKATLFAETWFGGVAGSSKFFQELGLQDLGWMYFGRVTGGLAINDVMRITVSYIYMGPNGVRGQPPIIGLEILPNKK